MRYYRYALGAPMATVTGMRFASTAAIGERMDAVVRELAESVQSRLGEGVDVALVFPSAHFTRRAEDLARELKRAIGARVLAGCTGEGVIGPSREIENESAVSLVAARLPDVTLTPFAINGSALERLAHDPSTLGEAVDVPPNTAFFVMVGDPFTAPMDAILTAFNGRFSGVPIIGGLASGARQPGETALFLNDRVIREGVVGVAFAGPIEADVIVSQGCRPVGSVLEVTSAHQNVIDSLEGEPPLKRIQALLEDLDVDDRELLRNGLFIGRAIDADKEVLGRGDFLIRGVVGVDSRSGAIAIGDVVEEGERVQFHLRDAATAREDLEMMLSPHTLFGSPSGALLFSCNGRGTRLYDEPDGDISAISGLFQGLDVAGFFCAGEIGPIGGRNFLHGHTACLALIRPVLRRAGRATVRDPDS